MAGGRLRQLVEGMRGQRLLVLGDIVADEQVVGRAATVAREAPVLVLEEVERTILPGGATNAAANAAALGAAVSVCGVLGDDAMGELLRERLRAAGIDVAGLVVDVARPTTTKTRIWAGRHAAAGPAATPAGGPSTPAAGGGRGAGDATETSPGEPAGGFGRAGRGGDVGLRDRRDAPNRGVRRDCAGASSRGNRGGGCAW